MDLKKIAAKISNQQSIRTAGRIEFIRDQGPVRRDIRAKDFEFKPESLKNLAKILWAMERSHSYGIASLRLISRMPASDYSPDGLIGGKGYIQQIKDLRSNLGQAIEVLSASCDTVHDEVNASHWSTAADRDPDATDIVEEAEQTRANPEQFVEQQFKQETGNSEFSNPNSDVMNPSVENPNASFDEEFDSPNQMKYSSQQEKKLPKAEGASQLPDDDLPQKEAPSLVEAFMNTTGVASLAVLTGRELDLNKYTLSSSSLPVETIPGGPRVKHIGPGESDEEMGGYSDQGERPSDDPLYEGFGELTRIYEGEGTDDNAGYYDPTLGDSTFLKSASYSWLPGSRNEKLMPYYDRSLTDEDIKWMQANDNPVNPIQTKLKKPKPTVDPLWVSRSVSITSK